MKRTFYLILTIIAFLGLILFWGNVFVIGDHIGLVLESFGISNWANRLVIIAWDILVGIGPFIMLAWIIAKNICGFKELNIENLLESQDDEKLNEALQSILEQPEDSNSVLDKRSRRRECRITLNTGNRYDKSRFLKEYYELCREELKKHAQQYAIFAAVSVVLSPKTAGDMLSLLIWQCRIISTALRIYGGRPSAIMVLRIYAKVLFHSLFVGSFEEVFNQFAFGNVEIKMLSLVTQALGAAATCIRTASLVQYYLYHGPDGDTKEALKESMQEIPKGLKDICKSDEIKQTVVKFRNCSKEIVEVALNAFSSIFVKPKSSENNENATSNA